MTQVEQTLKALDSFKDWTNYLLVTTVAALGWVSTSTSFSSPTLKAICIYAFAGSIFFAILTLAIIPQVGQILDGTRSIYYVYWRFYRIRLRLTFLCFPQHVLFLLGIIVYAVGTAP